MVVKKKSLINDFLAELATLNGHVETLTRDLQKANKVITSYTFRVNVAKFRPKQEVIGIWKVQQFVISV